MSEPDTQFDQIDKRCHNCTYWMGSHFMVMRNFDMTEQHCRHLDNVNNGLRGPFNFCPKWEKFKPAFSESNYDNT